jgi:hypothetical protein
LGHLSLFVTGAQVDALDPALFIGSSSEGKDVARALQADLDGECEATVWSQGIFEVGSTTFGELLSTAERADFAALVMTPDDRLTSRGSTTMVARDNVIFELGLFLGALGSRRVFIIRPHGQDLHLPSDLAGVTCLAYRHGRSDGNVRAAIGPAATEIRNRIAREGLRRDRSLGQEDSAAATGSAIRRGLTVDEERSELQREIDAIDKAAKAQGWQVKTHSDTAYRLVAKNGQRYSFPIGSPAETRDRLRTFAQQVNTAGLRVSQTVLAPVNS